MSTFQQEVDETREWFTSSRFEMITRLYSADQVVEQRGTIRQDYTIARTAAEAFYPHLVELFQGKHSITTFGPYSPGQAVAMKRIGIEGIYLGGWATSAKGSVTEDPGPDLASYPLSQVPDEAATIVRALLTADKNQQYLRLRMTEEERQGSVVHDFRPFIIADADTGHGGDPHVRNLIRRFVEVGVPGYHIEDQRPGTKKCGHQGGKVLVSQDEQIKRLNAARFQLDIMGVPGIIVARTDAEAANLIDGRGDERDQPFLLGTTAVGLPSYKVGYLALLNYVYEAGIKDVRGHLLYDLEENDYTKAHAWFERNGLLTWVKKKIHEQKRRPDKSADGFVDEVTNKFVDVWAEEADLTTYAEAVAEAIELRLREGGTCEISVETWEAFASQASLAAARDRAQELGVDIDWDCELAMTPEGYYQVRGGLRYAIARSLAVSPFSDLLWMETKTANLDDAREFSEAIHAKYPTKMLAYNLSPSFNWDTTGMSDDEIREFPEELSKLGFVFNFITYGGHQIDGVASEDFATAIKQDGMLALARLQRKIRLVESPYRTPQTLAGGPRLDAALVASSGRTATTKAMGKASTQSQHLVQTEIPTKLLEEWLAMWAEHYQLPGTLRVELRPQQAGSELLELRIIGRSDDKVANVIFSPIRDRVGHRILIVRDQNTFDEALRQKRLMTLIHLYLVHRYKVEFVHYVSPTDDNSYQANKMMAHGIFKTVNQEIGQIIVTEINAKQVSELLDLDRVALAGLITKQDQLARV